MKKRAPALDLTSYMYEPYTMFKLEIFVPNVKTQLKSRWVNDAVAIDRDERKVRIDDIKEQDEQ